MPPPEQRQAFPDKAHEDLATWVEDSFQAIDTTQADVDDSLWLVDIAFGLLDDALTDITTGTAARGHLQDRIADLEATVADLAARVAALESPAAPNP